MKTGLLVSVIVTCWALPALGQPFSFGDQAVFGGQVASSASPYLVRQTFEGTGYDNGESWTASGSPDPDDTTTPPEGSQCLKVACSGSAVYAYTTFAAQDTLEVYFRLRIESYSAANQWLAFWNADGSYTHGGFALLTSSGTLRVGHGSTTATTVAALSTNTLYHVWCRYTKGPSGTLTVGYSTDGTRPTSGTAYAASTSGDSTYSPSRIYCGALISSTYTIRFDKVTVSSQSIGANGDIP